MKYLDSKLSVMDKRHLGIGGSDANILWRNNEDSVYNLYKIKTLQETPENLSHVFPVQLGILSEELNIQWFEYSHLRTVERGGCYANFTDYKDYPHYTHTDGIVLDDYTSNQETFIECKHTNPFGSMKDKVISYLPQLQFYMMHLQVDYCYLSVIRGNTEPNVFEIQADKKFQEQLHKLCTKFWKSIEEKKFILEANDKKDLEKNPIIDGLKDYNMSDTEWDKISDTLDQTSGAVDIFESNKKKLKSLMPADAKTATTNKSNWIATRSKNNRVSIKQKAKEVA
jgi:hypothetical protein